MEFQRGEKPVAQFRGKVTAEHEHRKLRADLVDVVFDPEMNPTTIDASGDAQLWVQSAKPDEKTDENEKEPRGEEHGSGDEGRLALSEGTQWHLSASRIVGELEKELVTAQGAGELKVLAEDEAEDRVRWVDKMEVNFGDSTARFYGEVLGTFSGASLNCRELSLDFSEGRELRHINARGAVKFTTAGERPWQLTAESGEGIFAPGSRLRQVIAKKNVEVKDQQRRLRSELLTLFFEEKEETGKARLERAVAQKKVEVRYEGEEDLRASGQRIEWRRETNKYRLSGAPARVIRQKVSIKGENIIIDRQSGHISMPRGDRPAGTGVETP
jgi:lipopolysaccharide export system protein LptA